MSYETYTLPNGLRIIFMPSDSPVVYCGIAVAAGTRHEMAGEEGLAHFCEHLSFKGTQRRTAVQLTRKTRCTTVPFCANTCRGLSTC